MEVARLLPPESAALEVEVDRVVAVSKLCQGKGALDRSSVIGELRQRGHHAVEDAMPKVVSPET